jgi:hypothetical protein
MAELTAPLTRLQAASRPAATSDNKQEAAMQINARIAMKRRKLSFKLARKQ